MLDQGPCRCVVTLSAPVALHVLHVLHVLRLHFFSSNAGSTGSTGSTGSRQKVADDGQRRSDLDMGIRSHQNYHNINR